MSEEPPAPPGEKPKFVDNRKRSDRSITVEMYERMWELYRDMTSRSIRGLMRETGLSEKICMRAVNLGWPARNWPSLRERAKFFDKQRQEEADKGPLTEKQVLDLKRFMEMRQENLNVARAMRALGSRLAMRLSEAIEVATATRMYKRHRVIRVMVGRKEVERVVQEDIEVPPYLPHLAAASRDVAGIISAAGEAERHWAKIAPPEGADPEKSGWDSLTDEQYKYILENGGKLPPGVTPDQLLGRKS